MLAQALCPPILNESVWLHMHRKEDSEANQARLAKRAAKQLRKHTLAADRVSTQLVFTQETINRAKVRTPLIILKACKAHCCACSAALGLFLQV